MANNPKIFLSYSWANSAVADEIDDDFKRIGITFTRDKRDLSYRKSIKEFMQTIGRHDFVLMLVSDEYLKSENCMYEVTELMVSHEFKERILPIVLNNARGISKPAGRASYYDYWELRRTDAIEFNRKYGNHDSVDLVGNINNICNHLGLFFSSLTDLNYSDHATLKGENYRAILNIVGFDDEALIKEVLGFKKIEDAEEQEIAIEIFLHNHPNNLYGLFYKAWYAIKRGQYKKAKKAYENLLQIFPNNCEALFNQANLLTNHFQDHLTARKYYEKLIAIYPSYDIAYNNLGNLLISHFQDYQKAQFSFQKAIEINKDNPEAHYNLGILLTQHLGDNKSAIKEFKEALRINPQYFNAHNYLGILFMDAGDIKGARTHFEESINIDPNCAGCRYNFAGFLSKHSHDLQAARLQYEEAIRINLDYVAAHIDLGILLAVNLNEHALAKLHFEQAVLIDPTHLPAREILEKFTRSYRH